MKKARLLILLGGLILVVMLAGCDAGPPEGNTNIADATNAAATSAALTQNAGTEPDYLIVAPDQTIASDGLVNLERVKLADASYVVIRNDNGGQPGDTVLGFNRLSGGDFQNSSFTIDASLLTEATTTLWAVVHSDLGTNSVFEFPGADEPRVSSAGTIAMDSFIATK